MLFIVKRIGQTANTFLDEKFTSVQTMMEGITPLSNKGGLTQ